MKQLKFNPELVPLILSGQKTVTWRLFDDKDLSAGDELEFVDASNGNVFAKAIITKVRQKPLSEIDELDRQGHEKVGFGKELVKHYETLYKRRIHEREPVKIIQFQLKNA